jgi:hypothetical protein
MLIINANPRKVDRLDAYTFLGTICPQVKPAFAASSQAAVIEDFGNRPLSIASGAMLSLISTTSPLLSAAEGGSENQAD